MKKEELENSALSVVCIYKSHKICNLFLLPDFSFQNFRVVDFRYLGCFHLYAQQCPANVGVSIYRLSANDESELLQLVLNL